VPAAEPASEEVASPKAADDLSPGNPAPAEPAPQEAPQEAPAPEPVSGKEDVAGYPQPNHGFNPREVIDRFTQRVTQ